MDDTISKRSAIDALCDNCDNVKAVCAHYPCKQYIAIEHLPTAARKGKWEIDVDCEYDVFDIAGERTWAVKATCSECGFAMRFIEGQGVFNYCPNCGAKMI